MSADLTRCFREDGSTSRTRFASRKYRDTFGKIEMATKPRERKTPEDHSVESPSEHEDEISHDDDSSSALATDEPDDATLALAFSNRVNDDLLLEPNHPFLSTRIEETVREGKMNKKQATQKIRKDLLTLYSKPGKTDGQLPDQVFKQIRSVCESQLHSDHDRIDFLERMISRSLYKSVRAFLEEYLREKRMKALFGLNAVEIIANGHALLREDRLRYYAYASRQATVQGRPDVVSAIQDDMMRPDPEPTTPKHPLPPKRASSPGISGIVGITATDRARQAITSMINIGRKQYKDPSNSRVTMYTVAQEMKGDYGITYYLGQEDATRQAITRIIKKYDQSWSWSKNIIPLIESDEPYSL